MTTHHDGYDAALRAVKAQTLEEDLRHLDVLYGRDNLRYGATPEEVKAEVMRQVERDFRIDPLRMVDWGAS